MEQESDATHRARHYFVTPLQCRKCPGIRSVTCLSHRTEKAYMRYLRSSTNCLAITMLALIGLINGSVLPVAVQSTTVDKASESNSDSRSRADTQRNSDSPDRWKRRSKVKDGSLSAAPAPDYSTQPTTPGANGKIAFSSNQGGQWDRAAWKTDAFYGNPLTGFAL